MAERNERVLYKMNLFENARMEEEGFGFTIKKEQKTASLMEKE